jgi:hypothetical protein
MVGPLARRTQMEAEVIELTGWSVDELDACPAGRLERYLLYWNARAEQRQRDAERQR